jgi:hypothetical protein
VKLSALTGVARPAIAMSSRARAAQVVFIGVLSLTLVGKVSGLVAGAVGDALHRVTGIVNRMRTMTQGSENKLKNTVYNGSTRARFWLRLAYICAT